MKIDPQLYVELLEAEVRRLRAAQAPELRRGGALAGLTGLTVGEVQDIAKEYEPKKNLISEPERHGAES